MNKLIPTMLAIIVLVAGANVAQAERLSVKANIANIRSGPNTSDAVIWQVEKYHPLNVVKKKGHWYLFEDFEGDRGWIHDSLLANIEAVIVKNDKCNVRSGPGTDNDIRFTVDKGVPFKVLKKKRGLASCGPRGW
jgi:SH3-like domain-containing protein